MFFNSRVFLSTIGFGFVLTFSLSSYGLTESTLPFSRAMNQELEILFFSQNGLSKAKVDKYRHELVLRRDEVVRNFESRFQIDKGDKLDKAEKKAVKEDMTRTYDVMLSLVDAAILANPDEAKKLLSRAQELDVSITRFGKELLTQRIVSFFQWAFFTPWEVKKENTPEEEASNLLNEQTGKYYSPEDLVGKDVSSLDPPAQTSFWRKRADIVSVDIEAAFYGGDSALHEGRAPVFPSTNVLEFKKIKRSQSKPKMDVYGVGADGEKRKYKLKMGHEMHTDPTVSSLLNAIGFSTDITKYVRDVKVVFPKGITLSDMKNDWQGYFSSSNGWESYRPDQYIKEHGKLANGNEYVIFTEAVLEAKPKRLIRVGGFDLNENGYSDIREARGLLMFKYWISDTDLTAKNSKVILREEDDGKVSFHHIQHDMGHSLGKILREKADAFPWNMVRKETKKKIVFEYMTHLANGYYENVSYADLKWMGRMIAQFSRAQIEKAVEIGGWPKCIGALYTEKLLSRRNDIVRVFELEGEEVNGRVIGMLPVDNEITVPGCLEKGKLLTGTFNGYTQNFSDYYKDLLSPLGSAFKGLFSAAAQAAISGISKLKVDPEWFGVDEAIIAEFRINFARDYAENPKPSSHKDHFLVEDSFTWGGRLGAGIVVSGDVSYVETYRLIYPARYADEAKYAQNKLINFKLPWQIARKELPEKFVLIREAYLEGRGRIRVEGGFVSVGAQASHSKVKLSRVIIDNTRADESVLFNDTSFYDKNASAIYYRLGFLRAPFAKTESEYGTLNRVAYMVSKDKAANDPELAKAITLVTQQGDFSGLNGKARKIKVDVTFKETDSSFSFLGLLHFGKSKRSDKIDLDDIQASIGAIGKQDYDYIQVKRVKESGWIFLDNAETRKSKIFAFSGVNASDANVGIKAEPVISIQYKVEDKDTRDGELKKEYLSFVNGAADDKYFIKLTPELHSRNGRWGHTIMTLDVQYYKEAIDRLLSLNGEGVWDYWAALGSTLGIEKEAMFKEVKSFRVTGLAPSPVGRHTRSNTRTATKIAHAAIWRSHKMLHYIEKASETDSQEEKMKHLAKALSYAVYKKGGPYAMEYVPSILASLNKVVADSNFYMQARISSPYNLEKRLLIEDDMVAEKGAKRAFDQTYYIVSPEEIAEVYHISEWFF